MKRVRYNGGARAQLRDCGLVIFGDYASHQHAAQQLCASLCPVRASLSACAWREPRLATPTGLVRSSMGKNG